MTVTNPPSGATVRFQVNGHFVQVLDADGNLVNADGSPAHDYVAFTYYGSTNNIHTAVYKTGGSGGTTVLTQTFAYAAGGASDDDLLTSITNS